MRFVLSRFSDACIDAFADGAVHCVGILRREKKLVANTEIRDEIANAVFRFPVACGGVDEAPAARDERLNHLPALAEFRGIVLEIEYDGGADADDRNALAAVRNRARRERVIRGIRYAETTERAAESRSRTGHKRSTA